MEPPGADHPLLALPTVICTPHVGGNTAEVALHQGAMVAEELERLAAGQRPQRVANPEALEGFTWEPRPAGADTAVGFKDSGRPAVSDLMQTAARDTIAPRGLDRDRFEAASEAEGISRLHAIVARFIDLACTDQNMAQFAARRQVTLHFRIQDCGFEFHLRLDQGAVCGGMEGPHEPAEVVLKMKAEILDGMLTGRINPTGAALAGKISFTGDVTKAMTLQRAQKDLRRLYTLARQQVGDPGDLTAIGPSAEKPGAAVSAETQANSDDQPRLVAALNELYRLGLITTTGGNISVRSSSNSEELWITPSRIPKGGVTAPMMVRIDARGNPLDPNSLAPSSERMLHCALYRSFEGVAAVIHSHAPRATLLALAELSFLPVSTEAVFIGELPRIGFKMPGSRELADAVAEAMQNARAVLLQNHGLVVAAHSLQRAVEMTTVIEQTADEIITCHMLGRQPRLLPEQMVATLRQMGEMNG